MFVFNALHACCVGVEQEEQEQGREKKSERTCRSWQAHDERGAWRFGFGPRESFWLSVSLCGLTGSDLCVPSVIVG